MLSTSPKLLVNVPTGCLSIHSLMRNVIYLSCLFFENPIFFSSNGIKKQGNDLSFGTHLYNNFPCLLFIFARPYVFPLVIKIPCIVSSSRIGDFSIKLPLSSIISLLYSLLSTGFFIKLVLSFKITPFSSIISHSL